MDAAHTMCIYSGPSEDCQSKATGRELTETGKNIILEKHNELRRKVSTGEESSQPAASNMRKLVWNDELAAVAQRWTDQCTFGHDSKRNKIDGTYVGQNAYVSMSSAEADMDTLMMSMDASVQAWSASSQG